MQKIDGFICINGFQSTSISKETATYFAITGSNVKLDRHPVLYSIEFSYDNEYFNMNSPNYSKYCESEQEILLNTGLPFEIISIEMDKDLTVINLKFQLVTESIHYSNERS